MDESRQLEEILNTLVNKNDEEEEQISLELFSYNAKVLWVAPIVRSVDSGG
ncbi:7460_t:CDS:2 [Rhizophagus irregularis]|nr:7460_t:CDS:2 [Rhizophagus irregularis]